jgi:hypothetical protein
MKSLRIIRAKPNPSGKDRSGGYIRPAQLAAEWVDFQNDGDESCSLDGITLYHLAFQYGCRDPKWDKVMAFTGPLPPGKIVRVHSGEKRPDHDRARLAPDVEAGGDGAGLSSVAQVSTRMACSCAAWVAAGR